MPNVYTYNAFMLRWDVWLADCLIIRSIKYSGETAEEISKYTSASSSGNNEQKHFIKSCFMIILPAQLSTKY